MKLEQLSLDSITISKDRMRKDLGNLEDLATSIVKFGQLVPIIVEDETNELVDGERRFRAHQLNGATTIYAVRKANVDELAYRELELESNLRRKQMTAAEEVQAVAEIDRINRLRDPNWGQRQTAAKLGITRQATVSEAVNMAKMMDLFPELKEAKSIAQLKSWTEQKAKQITRVANVKNSPADYSQIEAKIHHGDSVEFIKTVPAESCHAIITDPPFGLDYGARVAGTSGVLTAYEDDADSYRRLLSMAPDLYRVLKPDGWLVWFFGMSWYREVVDAFTAAGFTVDPVPVIWDRSGGRSATNRPDRWFAKAYDVAIHAIKGNPTMAIKNKPNVIKVDPIENHERETLVERPTELYAELIRRLTVPGEVVADFFVGGGGCPAAAASLGRDFFGCELSAERRAYAIQKIKAHIPTKE